MRKYILGLLLVISILPAYGQVPNADGVNLQYVLANKSYPMTIKLKELNQNWVRLNAAGASDLNGYMMLISMAMRGSSGAYYTKSDTINIGTETYLIAYHTKMMQIDPALLSRSEPPAPEKLTPDTTLLLALLNLRTAGNLTDLQPFDINVETAVPASLEEYPEESSRLSSSSQSNLKQLALAMLMYTQDWDEKLPPMDSPEKVKGVLLPYARNESIFVNPATKEPYQPNRTLSKHTLSQIKYPADMVIFYELTPDSNGYRNVAFLDGHVKRVSEAEWEILKRKSKIP